MKQLYDNQIEIPMGLYKVFDLLDANIWWLTIKGPNSQTCAWLRFSRPLFYIYYSLFMIISFNLRICVHLKIAAVEHTIHRVFKLN